MAIKISGTTVIDDDRSLLLNDELSVGVVTITASNGNIETPGTITASGFDLQLELLSFEPGIGSTDVPPLSNKIVLTFNQAVGVATTGANVYVELRENAADGTVLQTLGPERVRSTYNGIIIFPEDNRSRSPLQGDFPGNTTIYPVIQDGFIQSTSGSFPGVNVGGSSTTYFFTTAADLGSPAEGGYLIAKGGGSCQIVSTQSAEVSRNWHSRNDAGTLAQAQTGCTGWFIPSMSYLRNTGWCCRSYWDSYSATSCYYSNQQDGWTGGNGCFVNFATGGCSCTGKNAVLCVRSFRTLTY